LALRTNIIALDFRIKFMLIEDKLKKNFVLAKLTTFKIGGPAKFFLEANDKEELRQAVGWAKKRGEPLFFLAGGSNILINDQGVAGLVIKLSAENLSIKDNNVISKAGASLSQLVKLANKYNLSGLEWAVGIPGTIGGAVYGDAGAFGQEMSALVKNIEAYDIDKDSFINFTNQQCQFSYRNSMFKQKKNLIITAVELELKSDSADKIKERINEYSRYRMNAQPPEYSAGSVFKNLTLTYLKSVNSSLAEQAEQAGIVKGDKVAAGWLIDKLDFKGQQIGRAKVSEKHANFIINLGQASADDVVQLISLIKQQIRNKFKVQLEEEVQYFGF